MASEPDAALIDSLKRAATDAVSNGTPIRLALKSGDVLEGVPESVAVDETNAPYLHTPLASFEREHFGPSEVTIMLAGTAVLAQEVREFAVVES